MESIPFGWLLYVGRLVWDLLKALFCKAPDRLAMRFKHTHRRGIFNSTTTVIETYCQPKQ